MIAKKILSVAVLAFSVSGLLHAQDRSDWPTSLKIGTASQGGTYFIYGSGLAKLIQEKLSIPSSAEVTGGAVQNPALIDTGRMELGLSSAGPILESMEGKNPLMRGKKTENLRVLFPAYQAAFQMATLKANDITTISGLSGKPMGVGPKAGTTAAYLPKILSTVGVEIDVRYGGASDQAGQVQDGLLTALGLTVGVPSSAFTQIQAQNDIVVLGFTDEQVQKLVAEYPSLTPFTIKQGTYKDQDSDVETVSMWTFVLANKAMPDSLAYAITKMVFESNAEMQQVHRSAIETVPENITKNKIVPLHPGAAKYYAEQGISIPQELLVK